MALLVADQTLHLYVHTCDTKKIPYSRVAALKNQISSAIEMKKKRSHGIYEICLYIVWKINLALMFVYRTWHLFSIATYYI